MILLIMHLLSILGLLISLQAVVVAAPLQENVFLSSSQVILPQKAHPEPRFDQICDTATQRIVDSNTVILTGYLLLVVPYFIVVLSNADCFTGYSLRSACSINQEIPLLMRP